MPYQQLPGYVPEEEIKEEEEKTEGVEINPNVTHGTRLWAIISIILAAIGIALVFVPTVGVFFGAAGIVFALISRKRNDYFYTEATVGIILGVICAASCVFFIIYNAMNEAGLVINIFESLLK